MKTKQYKKQKAFLNIGCKELSYEEAIIFSGGLHKDFIFWTLYGAGVGLLIDVLLKIAINKFSFFGGAMLSGALCGAAYSYCTHKPFTLKPWKNQDPKLIKKETTGS